MTRPQDRLPGVRWRQGVATFLLRSPHASGVDLCLFERVSARKESTRIPMARAADGLWEARAACAPGQLYGYRVAGPWDPAQGLRFNPSKILLDPWTLAVGRAPRWHDALVGEDSKGRPDGRDSAPWAPLGAVVDLAGLPTTGSRPRIREDRRVVYEAHAKGLTALHPDVPPDLRGTFAGAGHPKVVEHLRRLGVTTLELLPVQHHADDRFLVERGLVNYWGYSTLGYFAPHAGYASDPLRAWAEFRAMVRAYHDAGIEVVLDVVYNHTCEGPFGGPQLSWRGLGPEWYRRTHGHPLIPEDFTGCGNTVDFREPDVVRFVLESLGVWADLGGVDGFRYDLASVHGRLQGRFDPAAPFFAGVARDPRLSRLRHVAEPWDASWDGYAVGRFPSGWLDWNDRFRDDVRRFWRGDPGCEIPFARRMAGSADLFGARPASESLNFVVCHDGFTLHDVGAYSRKHNQANQEGNRDGSDHEVSDSLGFEGETDDPGTVFARARRARNHLASLLVAPGTPMLLGGDEFARTQRGNNNAYCQDNALSWIAWDAPPAGWPDTTWIAGLVALRGTLFAGATWESVPFQPGVVCLAWSGPGGEGLVLAQPAGPLRSLLLPGRFRRWLDTSGPEAPEPLLLPTGAILLRPASLQILERVH